MKFVLAIALALGVAAAAYGAAATLTVNGGAAQAGSVSASCDGDGVQVSYTLDGSGNVDSVTVSGIAGACNGADVDVRVEDASNNELETCNFADNSSASVTCDLTPNESVSNIDEVKVQIIDDGAG